MATIKISKHARQQMGERGISESEVIAAVESGEKIPAKLGRNKFRKNFVYGKEWGGHFYRTKQVVPVTVGEKDAIIVVTVLSFYF